MALTDDIRETRRAINGLLAGAQSATISTPSGTRSYTRPMLGSLQDHLAWLLRRYARTENRKRVFPDFSSLLLPLACLFFSVKMVQAELVPELLTLTWSRTDEVATVSGTYLTGSQILLTNCIAAGVTTGTVQNLTDLTPLIKAGNAVVSLTYTGVVQNATAGTWCATITLPTALQLAGGTNLTYSTLLRFFESPIPDATVRLELSLTNGTTRYTYRGDKKLATRSSLP
ncbi:MAG: hypothetical protein WCG26_00210 [Chloroflexales bacterium]